MHQIHVLVLPHGLRLSVEVPETRWERMRGLLGRDDLEPGRALLLEGARSVHTIGMRSPLRVAFLDRDLRILEARELAPGRIALPRRRAKHILECPAGERVAPGDRLIRLTEEGSDRRGDEGRSEGERGDEQHEEGAGPCWERERLPPTRLRLDEPEELQ